MFLLSVTSVSEHQRAAQAFKWHRNETAKSALLFGPVGTGRYNTGAQPCIKYVNILSQCGKSLNCHDTYWKYPTLATCADGVTELKLI